MVSRLARRYVDLTQHVYDLQHVPSANAGEAAVERDIELISVSSLSEAVGFFTGMIDIQPHLRTCKNYSLNTVATISTSPTSAVSKSPSEP